MTVVLATAREEIANYVQAVFYVYTLLIIATAAALVPMWTCRCVTPQSLSRRRSTQASAKYTK